MPIGDVLLAGVEEPLFLRVFRQTELHAIGVHASAVPTGRSHHALDDAECLAQVLEHLQDERIRLERMTCLTNLLDAVAVGLAVEESPISRKFTELVILKNLSVKQLAMRIQATFGKSPRAGRKPQVPQDTVELVTKLRMLSEKWVNFCRSAEARLSGKLATAVKNAIVEVGKVQELAEKSLTRSKLDPKG